MKYRIIKNGAFGRHPVEHADVRTVDYRDDGSLIIIGTDGHTAAVYVYASGVWVEAVHVDEPPAAGEHDDLAESNREANVGGVVDAEHAPRVGEDRAVDVGPLAEAVLRLGGRTMTRIVRVRPGVLVITTTIATDE